MNSSSIFVIDAIAIIVNNCVVIATIVIIAGTIVAVAVHAT